MTASWAKFSIIGKKAVGLNQIRLANTPDWKSLDS